MRTLTSITRFGALCLCVASAAAAQTPPLTPDVPPHFTEPTAANDYVKRDVMIPMRDGVKLYTVIVVPKGATQRADAPDAHALQRLRARDAQRTSSPHMLGDAAAGRRGLRRRRLHPRVPGRPRQVRIRRRLRHDAAAQGTAQREHRRSFDRRVRHDRLAGEERARVERQGRACSAARTKASRS